MKRMMMIAGGVAVAVLGGLAIAQMVPGENAQESQVAEEDAFKSFLRQFEAMGDEAVQGEDEYLRLDLGPEVDVSGIERVPSAEHNQPYRTCPRTPEMQANLRFPGGDGNRAYRDIEGYLSVTNVIATRDCTCEGKVIPHEVVAAFEDRLRERLGVDVLQPEHTDDLYTEYQREKKVVAAMCGEY